MDDDIRNRFRGVSRGSSVPSSYGRQTRPVRSVPAPVPRPVAKPTWPPVASKTESVAQSVKPPAPPKPPKPAKSPKHRHKKRFTKKKILLLIIILLVVVALAGLAYELFFNTHKKADQQFQQQIHTPQQTTQTTPKPTGTVRFIATGDNLAFDSINTAAKQADGSYNYFPMMNGFKPFFDKSDIRLCNETTPGGGDQNGLAVSGYPTFNAALSWSTGFAGLGCNLIDLASDHINDKGQPAIDATLNTWDAQKNILAVAGANRSADEQSKPHYFTVKGLKFAYLTYTTSSVVKTANSFSVNTYSDAIANAQIADAHKNAQLVIVSINWGTENTPDINASQDQIAQNLANQNVDVVVGGGPREIQPAKILSGTNGHQTLVWFSLGNFLSSELPIENLTGGMAVMDFDVATQQIKNPEFMPVYMNYDWTAAQKAAGTVNARNNFMLYPLDLAADALAKSQNGTTVDAQTSRITSIITKFAPIKVIKSTDF